MLLTLGLVALLLAWPAINSYAVSISSTQSVPTVSITDYSFEDGELVVECDVVSDGGISVSDRGVVWGTSENPTIADSLVSKGSGTGDYTATITGLADNTTYYVRAYATNTDGTAYSGQLTITVGTPTISTEAVHGVTASTAWSGGNITSDGGATITAYGICWGTTAEPTIDFDDSTNEGEGTAEFASQMTGLVAGTTYYVRAYAQTSSTVAYGETYSFVPDDTVSAYMIWHNQDSGKVIWWKLNNEGNQLDGNQGSGWDYVSEDITLSSNWSLAGTTVVGDYDTLIWHNQKSGKIAYWKLNSDKTLKNGDQGDGWDFVAPTITLSSTWKLVNVRNIDSEKTLFWFNEKNGKAAWWKLTDECYIKNETKGEGWDFASDDENVLGSEWNLAGVIDAN